jgi:hypothetical protein
MNTMLGPATVSAAVSLIGGIVSVVMWLRSKGEREEAQRQREEAARQADIATKSAESAATALTDIAELHKQRDQRQQARDAAAEHDPWLIQQLPDTELEADLYNDSDTPKYCVNVKLVGPRRRARIPYIRIGAPAQAIITWHLDEDCDGDPLTQTIEW